MKSTQSRSSNRRGGRGGGRRYPKYNRDDRDNRSGAPTPKKVSFWQKLIAFFTGGSSSKKAPARKAEAPRSSEPARTSNRPPTRKPENVEVTTPKLYVGNLSYDATESDLYELFNGVGQVQNAEIVSHRGGLRSKGFGFVTMLTVDEAIRAAEVLHDKDFMGRKLVVNGSKSTGAHSSYDSDDRA